MQFVSGISNLQCLLVLAAIFLTGSNALLCTTCMDRQSCTNGPVTQECNNELVALHHGLLWAINPNLAVPPTNANAFKCYDLDMSYQSPLTGSTVLVYQKGCTYHSTNFCEGWDDTSTVNRCNTCDSEDDCNKDQTEGTATPTPEGPTTTPETADTTTVTNSSPLTSSTTTEATTTTVVNPPTTSSTTTEATTTTVINPPTTSSTTTESITTTVSNSPTTSSATTEASTTTVVHPPASSSTTAEATTTTVTNTPSTSSSTTVSTAKPTTVTAPTSTPAGATNLGCWMNWSTIVGFALLHGLTARW